MTEEIKLYRIEEMNATTGEWNLIDQESQKMTREQTVNKFEYHVSNEVNPNRMRIVRER